MAYNSFYNVKDVSFTFTTNVPGATSFDAVQCGVDEGSQISFEGATDQVTLKEDITGQYAQFSHKNSRKTNITISAMRGTPLHYKLATIWEAQREKIYIPDIQITYKHPLDFNTKHFTGFITGYPRESVQGELEVLEYTLSGVTDSVVDIVAKNLVDAEVADNFA